MQLLASLILSAAALVGAQRIDPSTVPASTRSYWCQSQTSQCPLLCTQINNGSGAVYVNDCNSDNLDYSCVCGNNQVPNATEYSQTIPYFECTETNNRCVANCGVGASACAASCRDNNPCGALDPKRYNVTATSTTATATATGTSSSGSGDAQATDDASEPQSINGDNGSGDSQISSTDSNPNNISAAVGLAVDVSRVYGTAAVLGSIFLSFSLLL